MNEKWRLPIEIINAFIVHGNVTFKNLRIISSVLASHIGLHAMGNDIYTFHFERIIVGFISLSLYISNQLKMNVIRNKQIIFDRSNEPICTGNRFQRKNTSSHGVNMKITARIDMAFKQLVSNVMHLVSRAMTDIHKWRLCELNNRNKKKNQQHQQIYTKHSDSHLARISWCIALLFNIDSLSLAVFSI